MLQIYIRARKLSNQMNIIYKPKRSKSFKLFYIPPYNYLKRMYVGDRRVTNINVNMLLVSREDEKISHRSLTRERWIQRNYQHLQMSLQLL